jgi:hypothetical protein
MLLALVTSEAGPRGRHFGERAVSVRFAADVHVVCSSKTSAVQPTMVWFQCSECDAHRYEKC